ARRSVVLSDQYRGALWLALGANDAERAYQAVCDLTADAGRGVALVKERLETFADIPAQITRLMTDLDSPQFAVRERASQDLEKISELGEPVLRQVLRDKPTLETRRRIERVLEKLRQRKDTAAYSD